MRNESKKPPKPEQFLSVRAIAEELFISERSVWRLVENGELPVHDFGSSTRVKREALDTYIKLSRRLQDIATDECADEEGDPSAESEIKENNSARRRDSS